MASDFDKFIEDLKEKSDLIEVIEATSEYRFDTRRAGRFMKCKKPDSLMVDPNWGVYTWFAKGGTGGHSFETGDVFHWLERYASMGFWEAALWLANRYNVRVPEGGKKVDPAKEKMARTRAETFEIACRWFEDQLWKNERVVDYCHRRGWTDETIRSARLGFSPGYKNIKDLIGTLSMNEVNLDDPAAVSILGKKGGIQAWISAQGITDENPDWILNDQVHGLAAMPRLIYPHLWRGRVNYFSGRNLVEEDGRLVGNDKPKSFNLHKALAGERAYYFNFMFSRDADICLVVEGQADAISAGQLGFAAVALAGVSANEDLAQNFKKNKIKRIFVGLDNDKAGNQNALKTAEIFGPMTRLVTWSQFDSMFGDGSTEEETVYTQPLGSWNRVEEEQPEAEL